MTNRRKLYALAQGWLISCLLGFSAQAFAGQPPNLTEAEILVAGPYCMYAQGFPQNYVKITSANAAAVAKWQVILGEAFHHIHHYCWAKLNVARSNKSGVSSQSKRAARDGAIADTQYVIDRAQSNFILLPELHMYQGELQVLQSRPAQAEIEFRRAIELKPDFWPPYLRLADLLIARKQNSRAAEVVEEGLSLSPDAGPLLRLAKQLGVKTPVPRKTAASQPSKE